MLRANSHAEFMRWREVDLMDLAMDHARKLGFDGDAYEAGLHGLDKRGLARLCVDLVKRLSAREGLQGE